MFQNLKFKKQQRISDKAEISLIFNSPSMKASNQSGLILCRPNALSYNRLVIIVGKKNVKRAVDRSRVKRIIRAGFISWSEAASTLPCDYAFVARSGAMEEQKVNVISLSRLWKSFKPVSQQLRSKSK